MKIVLPGGSGQVGSILARALHGDGHEVVVLSRRPAASDPPPWRVVAWDAATLDGWVDELDAADAVINLAGRSVNCRYNRRNRAAITASRVDSTRLVGRAIAAVGRPPGVWLQMSTATIYAHRFDAANDEQTGVLGGDEPDLPDTWRFSLDVAGAWEGAARDAVVPDTRRVLLRSAMVMSPDDGGVFDTLLRLVRFGLGGRAGSGRQYVSWIHEADFVRAVYHLIDDARIEGAVNLAAPHPLPNADFMRELRRAWGAPLGLPANRWMLEVGALLLRSETELVLKSRRVVSRRLAESGFTFSLPEWRDAARELCDRWRCSHQARAVAAVS
ncbi:MAG: TIGR01777 family oxidoreductase [Pirellulaceae bacterium]